MSPRFLFVTPETESFSSDFPKEGWGNLACVECLYMIKPMVVGFCFTEG